MAQFNPPSFARPREYGDIPRSIDAVFEAYQQRKNQARANRIQDLGLAAQGIDPALAMGEGPESTAYLESLVSDFIARRGKKDTAAGEQSAAELEKTKAETEALRAPKNVDALLAKRVQDGEITLEEAVKMKASSTPGANIKAPPGFRFTSSGNLEAIPGGPAALKEEKIDEKSAKSSAAMADQSRRIIGTIDQALSKVGYTTAGIGGQIMSNIPGTQSSDLEADLATIKANLGFAELQAMRQSSPTGGALGAVSERELIALESTIASLKQKQSPEQLRKRLLEIKDHYSRWADTVSGKATQATPAKAPTKSGRFIVEVE